MSDPQKWFKSSYSGSDGGDRAEIAAHSAAIHVRDPQAPQGPTLAFTPEAWAEFTAYATASARTSER
ncbi:DUF397 domain-containing protein [Streptomyces sp. V4-01]|uniref:DUF397 domain-containing protein n=1 Tax=Actinacidiphila polyblastidii TaxID=3110430 RepID=A0ABU7PKE4_9ACTN|nr:DUF397 domain-containing protein [Streptomyces sp. V4-01]